MIDNNKVLSILINLINKQFTIINDPQKLIINGKGVFIRLFKFYVDNLSSAKTFLVATLQEPIEYLLMNDDLYLDISSKITKERLYAGQTLKYQDKITEFRKIVVNRIGEAVNIFINKLTESFILLPENYVVIVKSLFKALSENTNLRRIDVLRTCIDFIFDCFIYPAMLNPEIYGIIGDFPLSTISKHNLIEIGKIIKSLIYGEINKANNFVSFEAKPLQMLPKDLLEKFEDYSLHSLITELSIWSETTISDIEVDVPNSIDNAMDLNRSLSLISETDLYFLLKSLKCFTVETNTDCAQLNAIISRISAVDPENEISKCFRSRGYESLESSLKDFSSAKISKSKFVCKLDEADVINNSPDLNVLILIIDPYIECPGMKAEEKIISERKCHTDSTTNSAKNYDEKVHSQNSEMISNSMSSLGHHSSRRDSSSSRSCFSSCETSIHTTSSCRKLKVSVDKITDIGSRNDDPVKVNSTDNVATVISDIGRKRTHFTDQEFIGTTSDFVEGISDVGSTHSVQSEDVDSRFDLEDNNEQAQVASINNSGADTITRTSNYVDGVANTFIHQSSITSEHTPGNGGGDNARSTAGSIIPNSSVTDLDELRAGVGAGIDDGSSDLVYWQNISGRDTPSMSGGRDSPSSSVGGSDLPNNVKPDITEKFCKFDIPKTVEARSTVSDTWSTDVLASDSETTEQIENRRLVEIQEENHPATYSQIVSESEDNSENAYNSMKPSNPNTVEKAESDSFKSVPNDKVSLFQSNRSGSPVTKESSVPTIQLESTLTSPIGVKFKSNSYNRPLTRSSRNTGPSSIFHTNEEDKPRSQSHATIESRPSESPSTSRKGLVEKIRDKFASTKIKRDSKTCKIDNMMEKYVEESTSMKVDQVSSYDLESIEQMLLRYGSKSTSKPIDFSSILNATSEDESAIPAFYDPKTPPESWPAWKVSKRNLRIILERLYIKSSHEKLLCINHSSNDKHPLIRLLKVCLAEANHLQQDYMITQLEETLRVIQLFDNESISRMVSSMCKDLKKRKVYITYLVNTHTQLRLIKKRAEELLSRCNRNCQVTSRSMISFCVNEILREQNASFESFFKQISSKGYNEYAPHSIPVKSENDDSSELSGSRGQSLADMLDWASRIFNNQPYLSSMTPERQQDARMYLERVVMSQLHRFSITLNDDMAELDRDNVFHRELENLQKTISPVQLSINKKFHSLLPFEAAQKELLKINCYKTPQDKVSCIQKTTYKIAILLKMTKPDFIPGADDILPVLIYVIIMSNPSRLLSNVAYIDTLCADQLEGQNQYMWCQFTAAVNEVRRLLTSHPRGSSRK